jgi:hypothetical protein
MESPEWLVLLNQTRNHDSLSNDLVGDLAVPFACDLGPRQAALKLLEHKPHNGTCAFERGLTTGDLRVDYDVTPPLWLLET